MKNYHLVPVDNYFGRYQPRNNIDNTILVGIVILMAVPIDLIELDWLCFSPPVEILRPWRFGPSPRLIIITAENEERKLTKLTALVSNNN